MDGLIRKLTLPRAASIAALLTGAIATGVLAYQSELGQAILILFLTTALLAILWHNATSMRVVDSARRETKAALAQSQAHYDRLFEDAPVPMYRTSMTGTLLAANAALLELLGVRDATMIIGSNVRRWYVDGSDRDAFIAAVQRDGIARGQIIQLCRDDGRTIWVMDSSRLVRDDLTGATWFEGGLVDVTERRAVTDQLRASERRFRALIENSSDGIALISASGIVQYISPSASRIVGRRAEEREGRSFTEFVHYDDQPALLAAFREVLAEHCASRRVEVRYKHSDGEWHLMEGTFTNRLEEPDIHAVVVNYRDVTEQMRAVVALRESETRFRQMAEHINEAFFVVDLETRSAIYVSPGWSEIWGRPVADGYDAEIWFQAIHPDDQAAMAASQVAVARGEKSESEFRVVRPDGTTRWVRGRAFPVRNADGRVYRMVGVAVDVTELRNAQEKFTQAQKMEAVGRLAGGVAHDFNNLLTVILTDTEVVRSSLPAGSEEAELLAEVRRAGESAVGLTRQLLAFSRKQLVEPTVFNLNDAVTDISKMLRRLIGEDVRLETKLVGGNASIRADRGQIEQVLTNLAVNARDAMPQGGSLTLETKVVRIDESLRESIPELPVGEYIVLAVSDTGNGMSEETRAHAFEPFFTTKGLGKGTGLGLATCHGIVKQSGGHVTLYSEVGVGTTFRIYLPRVAAAAEAVEAAVAPTTPKGNETILVVEDDPGVRRVGARLLRAQGYRVLEAEDAVAAQHVLREHTGVIDLLFTDVVLPGVGGRELAERVRDARPSVKVLFTSGYTDDVILRHQLISHDVAILQKPYSQSTLSQKVRAVLDAA